MSRRCIDAKAKRLIAGMVPAVSSVVVENEQIRESLTPASKRSSNLSIRATGPTRPPR